ncbi:MAG: type II secretion system protein [Armatimonadota bacterium]
MKKRNRGHTLVEVIVSMVIITLMIVLVAQLSVNSWRYVRYGSAQSDQFAGARTLMNNLSEAIMASNEVYDTSPDLLTVRRTYYIGGPEVKIISYKMEENKHKLFDIYKIEYPLDYDPKEPSKHIAVGGRKTLVAKNVSECTVKQDPSNPKLYNITMELTNLDPKIPKFNIKTKVLRKK